MGTIVNKRELAESFNCHQSTIDRYLIEGMPFLTKGNRRNGLSTFDLEECKAWRTAKLGIQEGSEDETMNQARLRKMQADASLAELELEIQKGTVVAIEDVIAAWSEVFSTVKTRLLALSAKLPGLTIGVPTERELQDVFDSEFRTVLSELVNEFTMENIKDDSNINDNYEGAEDALSIDSIDYIEDEEASEEHEHKNKPKKLSKKTK